MSKTPNKQQSVSYSAEQLVFVNFNHNFYESIKKINISNVTRLYQAIQMLQGCIRQFKCYKVVSGEPL